jgi:hypothetical protein
MNFMGGEQDMTGGSGNRSLQPGPYENMGGMPEPMVMVTGQSGGLRHKRRRAIKHAGTDRCSRRANKCGGSSKRRSGSSKRRSGSSKRRGTIKRRGAMKRRKTNKYRR